MAKESNMSKTKIAGWVLSVLLSIMLLASAAIKLSGMQGMEVELDRMGWSASTLFYVGLVEAAIAVVYLVPPASFVGAVLMTGYLGGATATHVRIDDPFFVPIVLGVVAWIALGLRDRRVFALAAGSKAD
jgi:hypothetical protein